MEAAATGRTTQGPGSSLLDECKPSLDPPLAKVLKRTRASGLVLRTEMIRLLMQCASHTDLLRSLARDGASAPPLPPVAAPLPIDTDPLVPDDVVPELKLNAPLTPLMPAFADLIVIAPLVVFVPALPVMVIAPPVLSVPTPELMLTPPPTVAPRPPESEAAPPVLELSPAVIDASPPAALVPEPTVIDTAPPLPPVEAPEAPVG